MHRTKYNFDIFYSNNVTYVKNVGNRCINQVILSRNCIPFVDFLTFIVYDDMVTMNRIFK